MSIEWESALFLPVEGRSAAHAEFQLFSANSEGAVLQQIFRSTLGPLALQDYFQSPNMICLCQAHPNLLVVKGGNLSRLLSKIYGCEFLSFGVSFSL